MSLQAKNITKIYGTQKALDSVSFEINTGEIVGFLGPNGAGKSTMMKIITGYVKQNSGEVFVNGININDQKSLKDIKKQIGYLPEHNPLYLDMYVKEYLNFVAKIYDIKGIELKNSIKNIIDITGLGNEQHKKIGALSKGYRQRTGLAAALIHNPEVLILDEPTTGLDPNQILEIRNLIKEVGKEKTVMLSTHIMQEVEAICQKVIIINEGKIAANTNVSEIGTFTKNRNNILIAEFDKKINKDLLSKIDGIVKITEQNTTYQIEYKNNFDIRGDVFKLAVATNTVLLEMFKKEESMEDIFRHLTR